MKKCEYCGRDNADEAAACSGCGQAWFTAIPPVVEQQAANRKENLSSRFLVALLVGLAVSGISLFVAWQNARVTIGLQAEQWKTQMQLRELNEALQNYRKEFNAFPPSLKQLKATTNYSGLLWSNEEKGFVDGWDRDFVYSFDGRNGLITSYGHDGKPGGVGLDYDLTNLNPVPKDSEMTFFQFLYQKQARGMIATCLATGGIAFLLCFFTVKQPRLNRSSVIALAPRVTAIVITTCIVAAIISLLYAAFISVPYNIPAGH